MIDIQGAPARDDQSPQGSTPTEIVPTNTGTENYSPREAANALSQYRGKRDGAEPEAEAAPPAETPGSVPQVSEPPPLVESTADPPTGHPGAICPPPSLSHLAKHMS